MIPDDMIREIQELKLAGYTVDEAYDELKSRHTKVPTKKTVCVNDSGVLARAPRAV